MKKGDVVVRFDDAEQKAKLAELDGQLAMATVALERAKLNFNRVKKLRATQNESQEREDETRLGVASAEAQIKQLGGGSPDGTGLSRLDNYSRAHRWCGAGKAGRSG